MAYGLALGSQRNAGALARGPHHGRSSLGKHVANRYILREECFRVTAAQQEVVKMNAARYQRARASVSLTADWVEPLQASVLPAEQFPPPVISCVGIMRVSEPMTKTKRTADDELFARIHSIEA